MTSNAGENFSQGDIYITEPSGSDESYQGLVFAPPGTPCSDRELTPQPIDPEERWISSDDDLELGEEANTWHHKIFGEVQREEVISPLPSTPVYMSSWVGSGEEEGSLLPYENLMMTRMENLSKLHEDLEKGEVRCNPYPSAEFMTRIRLSPQFIQQKGLTYGQVEAFAGMPDLARACILGELEVLWLLLRLGMPVDEQDCMGRTSLQLLMDDNVVIEKDVWHRDMCLGMLLQAGANVNFKLLDGITPLHRTAAQGHIMLLWRLLEVGARINEEDRFSFTPLEVAVRSGTISCAEILLVSGASTCGLNRNVTQRQLEDPKYTPKAKEFLEIFMNDSLKHLAREAVRTALCRVDINCLPGLVYQLEITRHLKQYLLYRTECPLNGQYPN